MINTHKKIYLKILLKTENDNKNMMIFKQQYPGQLWQLSSLLLIVKHYVYQFLTTPTQTIFYQKSMVVFCKWFYLSFLSKFIRIGMAGRYKAKAVANSTHLATAHLKQVCTVTSCCNKKMPFWYLKKKWDEFYSKP